MKELMFSVFPSENFVDLGLYQFGYEQCKPAHSFGPAVRNHFLFHYIISGTGILMANDSHGVTQTYHVKSGQGFMIFPGQINTYISDEKLPWEFFIRDISIDLTGENHKALSTFYVIGLCYTVRIICH